MDAPPLPPPGWYHDGLSLRWWDGGQWGPYAPVPQPVNPIESGRTLAVLSHLGLFLGGFILPLVLRLTEGERNPYVKHHATEALNLNLTVLLVYVSLYPTSFIAMMATGGRLVWLLVPVLVLVFASFVLAAVFSIVGAVRASHGHWYRYPLVIRFVKGARPVS
jgi:uncharacterized Tic20 family protein